MSFLILLSFLISGCANFNTDRSPASTIPISDSDVAKVFEFDKSTLSGKTDYKKAILQMIKVSRLYAESTHGTINSEIAVEFIEDSSLPPQAAYYPMFQVKNNKYKIIVLHSKEAIYDPVASEELRDFLVKIDNQKYFVNHFAAFEMYYNAQEKNPAALHTLAKLREYTIDEQAFVAPPEDTTALTTELHKRSENWGKEKNRYETFVKQDAKIQKEKDSARRTIIDVLDKVSEDQQFKTLIANNDRKGVSKLLKQYLPWEQMAPFEKKFWENHLDIIENPLPLEQRVLVYRGIDDDIIYAANEAGQTLDKEIAEKEAKVFFMSSIITKNQGTWNRRLRSLTAMNEKFIGTDLNGDSEFTKSARITTMFFNHSREPKGSPFLSLTPSFEIAKRFGDNKMSAYLVDPRAMSYNYASNYKIEVEYLLPLTVFPDEVIYLYDSKIHTSTANSESTIKYALQKKLVSTYGQSEGEALNNKIIKNTHEYFDAAENRYAGKKTAELSPNEPNVVIKFFSSLFIKKPTEEIIAVPMGQSCMDLISQFWK